MWKLKNTWGEMAIFVRCPSGIRKENLRIYEADITKVKKSHEQFYSPKLTLDWILKKTFWVIGYQIILFLTNK